MPLEKDNYDKAFLTIASSISFNFSIPFSNVFVYFTLIQKKKTKSLFFFLLVFILMGGIEPKVFGGKDYFLGFFYKGAKDLFYNLILLYLPLLSIIPDITSKVYKNQSFLVFNSVPFVYELDNLCSRNSGLVDYFPDFRIIFFFKFIVNNIVLNEYFIRSQFKVPLTLI